MPRTLNGFAPNISDALPAMIGWADALGDALGRGIARGLNDALRSTANYPYLSEGPRKRGRPAKPVIGFVPAEQRCSVPGCGRPSRSKGLCSAHYQAARRKRLAKA
jgi:hypothetical protein